MLILLSIVIAAVSASPHKPKLKQQVLQEAVAAIEESVSNFPDKVTFNIYNREGLGENLPYPDVDYLGVGYDIIFGNPQGDQSSQLDPGFRANVVTLEWCQNMECLSRDMQFLQPLHGFARPEHTCYASEQTVTETSMSDYQSSLAFDASVEGEVDGIVASGAFSASYGYNSFQQDVVETSSERYELNSYCLQYFAAINPTDTLTLDPFYQAQLDIITANPDDVDKWMAFFEVFGTHYVSKLHLGGKMSQQITIKSSDVSSLVSSGHDVAATISGSYGVFSGSASAGMSISEEAQTALSNTQKQVKTLVLGGLPPPSGANTPEGFSEWAETVMENPMPVRYSLQPLPGIDTALFDKHLVTYMEKHGVDPSSLITVSDNSVSALLKSSTESVIKMTTGGHLKCSTAGEKFLTGFNVQLNGCPGNYCKASSYVGNAKYGQCVDSQECTLATNAMLGKSTSLGFGMCSPDQAPGVVTITGLKGASTNRFDCPLGYQIGMGFVIAMNTNHHNFWNIQPCTPGESYCERALDDLTVHDERESWWSTTKDESHNGAFGYLVCVDSTRYTNFEAIQQVSASHHSATMLSCPQGTTSIAGLAFNSQDDMTSITDEVAVVGSGEQEFNFNHLYAASHGHISWLACAP